MKRLVGRYLAAIAAAAKRAEARARRGTIKQVNSLAGWYDMAARR
ncbi:hypothetical protein CCC_00898 [Paramagnetospirillum magnetotacticum MS-1]|uniref:Uncharacterized protein n=1 Tax=Paramagnetospirillum magnetotacticum MS-1 TaxID=272627 RepID=A0A0C2U8L2_PARME|nr:hypothetical protein CCC_00898 [Paramagnetospirillum magnetotacticum MS-1]